MQRQLLHLTWNEFDCVVIDLADRLKGLNVDSVHGVPRGGLCLAIALSHKLGLPLLKIGCTEKTIIVDDIVDSGKTMKDYDRCPVRVAWVARKDAPGILSYRHLLDNQWIVFPWEDRAKAEKDMEDYAARQ